MQTNEMDLGFSLGWSNQSTVHSRMNNNSGVGVNAATRVNMSFVASEPLFELVWCPNKGLSLKCVDYSLNKDSSSLLWDVKQSNMVPSAWDRPINESKLNGGGPEFGSPHGPHRDQENQRTTDKSNLPSLFIGRSKLALDFDKIENKMDTHSSPIALLQEKSDSTSENKGKEKEKALFDGETNQKTPKDGDDDDDDDENDNSQESMESCGSVGLFSKGNKRWRFEQNLIVGTKRIKKQVQEESSFMNWIANMVKDLPKPNHDEGPTNRGLDYDEKIITSNKTHEPENGNTGFQTVFKSFYSQKTKVNERRILNEVYPLTSYKEDKACGDIIVCNKKKPLMGTGCSSDLIWHGKMVSEKRIFCSEEIQKPKVPLCRNRSLNALKGMFDAISKLRLSRTDILRWKNSCIPLSNLDGLFVRLRLGKSEGLGGTGYYVASVNGMQRENLAKNSKNPISVSIGGINCVVESQYVSNHDFLEDELIAWWEITSKSGKIPSEGDLKSKFGERKKLGF